jgi:PAS domain S-box-containing protein
VTVATRTAVPSATPGASRIVVRALTRDLAAQWLEAIRRSDDVCVEIVFQPEALTDASMKGSIAVIDASMNAAAALRLCETARVPAIVVAARGNADERDALLRAGAVAYIDAANHDELSAVLDREVARVRRAAGQREELTRLRLAEARMRDLIAVVPGAVWEQRFGTDGVRTTRSTMLSRTHDDPSSWFATPDLWPELLHPEDRERVEAALERLRRDRGGMASLHYRILTPESETLWLETHCRTMREGNTVTGLRGITMNVTAREQAQQRSHTLARAFQAASDMILILDRENRLSLVNSAFLSETGWTESEAIGTNAEAILMPEWLPDGDVLAPRRTQGIRRDGSLFPCLVRRCRIAGDDGETIGYAISATNISDFVVHEELLRRHEEILRHLVEAAFDGVMLHDGVRVLEMNQRAAAMLGVDATSVIGRDVRTFIPPEGLEALEQHLSEPQARYEMRCLRNGEPFDAEISAATITHGPTHVRVVAMRDITDRNAMLNALRQNEQDFRSLSQAAFDAVLLHEKGRVVSANAQAAAMFRCDVSSLIGRSVFDLTAPEYHAVVRDHVGKDSSARFESVAVRADGTTFPVEVCGVSTDGEGRRVVALRDLTAQKNAERELLLREERFRVLSHAAFDGILIERNGRIVEANDAFAEMFGYATSELRDTEVGLLLVSHRALFPFQESQARVEGEGHRKDGSTFPLELCVAATSTGENVYAVRDLTREKRAEQELLESERRYRDLSESTHDLICHHDLSGAILEVNAAGSRATGYSPEEMTRMTFFDLLPERARPAFDRYLETVQRDGVAEGMMSIITRDGDHRVWHFQSALRSSGPGGPVVRGLARDVTERERAVRALRKSEEHFRSIIEQISDLVTILDESGTVQYFSPSVMRTLAYDETALQGQPFISFIHPDDLAEMTSFFEQHISRDGGHGTIDARIRHADGSWRWFSMASTTRVTRGARSLILNSRDVTERRLLLSQLEQANRVSSLGRLAATVAHEFNNVLMGMQPFAELMQRRGVSPDVIAKGAGYIANSIARGKRVALDLLRFTQPAEPSLAPVRLDEWWERLAPELGAMIGNYIELEASIPAGISVRADARQLSQILSNLVSNARDAMPRGGSLRVEARRPQRGETFAFGVVRNPHDYIQISVSDTGSGMSPDVLRHAFDPLFTTKQSGGTGLGLAVVHQIITRHEGAIFVDSAPGAGTTFHLFIPAAAETKREEAPQELPRLTPMRILVVDDEPGIVDGLVAALQPLGMQTRTALTAACALDAARNFHPDLAVLDIRLPDGDGMELGTRLRRLYPSMRIVFASGHADANRIRPDDANTAFLQKPFDLETLAVTMVRLGCGAAR